LDQVKEEGEEKKAANDQPEEQAEPVLTLDDYMKENQMNLEYQISSEQKQGYDTVDAGKGLKVHKQKEKDWVEAETKTKNVDNITKSSGTGSKVEGLVLGKEPSGYNRKQAGSKNKQKKASDLKNDDFPALG